jgi:N-acyl-D-aspartate/D-glutamate deacylase
MPRCHHSRILSSIANMSEDSATFLKHASADILQTKVRTKITVDLCLWRLAMSCRYMTLMPARRLEVIAPSMTRKGRIQVGADADITIFDADTIIDTATFEGGLSFSEGIHYVLVNGVPVVDAGKTVEGVFPGEAELGKYRQ